MVRRATNPLTLLSFALLLLSIPAYAGGDVTAASGIASERAPALRSDVWFNTGGAFNAVPEFGGWYDEYGVYFIATIQNAWDQDLQLVELGFPCVGPATGEYGWGAWTDAGGPVPPEADPSTAEFHGSFTPQFIDPNNPPGPDLWYNYIDVTAWEIIVPRGTFFTFGYEVTGLGGLIGYNGADTWSWWQEEWIPLEIMGSGCTAVVQFRANYAGPIAVEPETWGGIKSLLR